MTYAGPHHRELEVPSSSLSRLLRFRPHDFQTIFSLVVIGTLLLRFQSWSNHPAGSLNAYLDIDVRQVRAASQPWLTVAETTPGRRLCPMIDVNQCAWPELCLLPGIHVTLAKRITQYRALNGPFECVDDMQRVHGIGPVLVERIRGYVVCDGSALAMDLGSHQLVIRSLTD